MPTKTRLLPKVMLSVLLSVLLIPSSGLAGGNAGFKGSGLTIYFTRHLQKETVIIDVAGALPYGYSTNDDGDIYVANSTSGVAKASRLDHVCGEKKCAEVLNAEGEANAQLLADWFSSHGITRKLDAVYATHKVRTQQTVQAIADDASLDVTQVPASGTELNPESTTPSECATLGAITDAQAAGLDTILVAGHSGTLYDIMGDGTDCGGLGLDTTDNNRFPKDDAGKVRDYGDIWKVILTPRGNARFVYRQKLKATRLSTVTRAN